MRGSGVRCDTGHSFIHSRFSFWSNEASREPKVLLEEFVSSSGSVHLKRVRAITPETHSSTATFSPIIGCAADLSYPSFAGTLPTVTVPLFIRSVSFTQTLSSYSKLLLVLGEQLACV